MLRIRHLIRLAYVANPKARKLTSGNPDRSPPSPQGKVFLFCKLLLHSKSQQLEPLAGSIGLLALVHTTRLTGGYNSQLFFVDLHYG